MLLGYTNWRDERLPITQFPEDRFLHTAVFGRTGTGKSTLLVNMVVQDIRNGHGVVLIDPHGDLADQLLDYVPSHRTRDAVIFTPADFPIRLDILEPVPLSVRHLLVSMLVSTFRSMWGEYFLHVQEQLLRKSSLTFMSVGGFNLLDIPALLTDTEFRSSVVSRLEDSGLKDFWTKQFNPRKDEYRMEYAVPLLNKIDQFAAAKPVADCIKNDGRALSLDMIRRDRRILICNLSGIGRQEARLLSNLLIAKLFLEAAKIRDPRERVPVYLYVDEIGAVATDIIQDILSEARKFRLGLTFAAQYLAQLPEEVIPALIGNLGHLICFGIGSDDAERLKLEFAPTLSPADLVNRDPYEAVFRLTYQGKKVSPFTGITLPSLDKNANECRSTQIIQLTRQRFGS
jgi:hypothetical protein